MQQQSSNHSEHSNLFALSSDSSRISNTHKRKKQHYSSFVDKVKHLLQADSDDLDELYRKVELIVKKYFNQHKIVEFSDMYEHIAALKTNGAKMSAVVGLLQKRLAQQHRQYQQERNEKKSSRRKQYETQTNSKQQQIIAEIKHKQPKQQQTLKHFKQSVGDVLSSVEQAYPIHSFHKSDAMTTNMSQDQSWHNRKQIKREESPSRYSPDKLNSSFEQYQSRNRQYEQKVRQLLWQLSEVKRNITHNGRQQHQTTQAEVSAMKEQLRLKLEQNRQNELRSETSLIDTLQKHIMKETNLTEQNEFNSNSRDVHIENKDRRQKLQPIKQKSNQSINSHKTVGSNKQIAVQYDQQPPNQSSMPLTNKQQYQAMSVEQKKQLVLEQANNITNQLKQLKAVASQLHSKPNNATHTHHQNTQNGRPRSQHSSVSQISNNIFATLQTNNNQILDKISPTTSKPIIETNIPSFKHVQQEQQLTRQEGNIANKNSVHMIESSAFSFSDNATHPPLVELRPVTRSNYATLSNQYARPHLRENSRYNGTAIQTSNNQTSYIPQQMETIKYIYNPYGNIPQTYNNPSIHFQHAASGRSISQSSKQIGSPLIHNNSATSIMRNTFNTQFHNTREQRAQSSVIRFDNGKYSHLKRSNLPVRSSANIEESRVNAVNNYSMVVGNASTLRKRGINMLSPQTRPFLHR